MINKNKSRKELDCQEGESPKSSIRAFLLNPRYPDLQSGAFPGYATLAQCKYFFIYYFEIC